MQVQRLLEKDGTIIKDHQPDDIFTRGCLIGHTSFGDLDEVCEIEEFLVPLPYEDMGLEIVGINKRKIYKVEVFDNRVRIIFKEE